MARTEGRQRGSTKKPEEIPFLVYWGFLAFVFSIPIEGLKLGPMTLAKVSGICFLGIYLLYYNPFFSHIPGRKSFPRWPVPLWGFGLYLLFYVLHGFLIPAVLLSTYLPILFTLVQLVFVFWIASGLLRNHDLARHSVLAFAASTVFLACAMLAQLPGFYEVMIMKTGQRVTALGYNPNTLGVLLAMGAVALVGLRLNPSYRHWMSKSLLLLAVVPLLMGMIKTGSRTSLVIFVLGFLVYLAPFSRGKRKITAVILAVIGAMGIATLVASNVAMQDRITKTLESGSMAGREHIFPTAVAMILEKPVLGWQPIVMWYELGERLYGFRATRDAHNLYLHLFLEMGALGAVPFLFGMGWCGWNAWKRRTSSLGPIPFSLWLVVIVGNMSGTDYTMKSFWYVLAMCVGLSTKRDMESVKRPRVVVTRRAPVVA